MSGLCREDVVWARLASTKNFGDPSILWDNLWPNLNLMQFQLLNKKDFFAEAIAASQQAQDLGELNDILKNRLEARLKQINSIFFQISSSIFRNTDNLQTETEKDLALVITEEPNFDNIAELFGSIICKKAPVQTSIEKHESIDKPHISEDTTSRTDVELQLLWCRGQRDDTKVKEPTSSKRPIHDGRPRRPSKRSRRKIQEQGTEKKQGLMGFSGSEDSGGRRRSARLAARAPRLVRLNSSCS